MISELDLHSVGRILLNFNCCHDLAGVKKGIKRLSWRDRGNVAKAAAPGLRVWTVGLLRRMERGRGVRRDASDSW